MQEGTLRQGRVLRVGRGWADVAFGHTVRRVILSPNLLVRVGNSISVDGNGRVIVQPQEYAPAVSRGR